MTNISFFFLFFQTASGTGLAFILFTEAVNQFPLANLWAVMFFLMLLALGLDSQFGTLQGVVQCIVDLKLFGNLPKEIMTGNFYFFHKIIQNSKHFDFGHEFRCKALQKVLSSTYNECSGYLRKEATVISIVLPFVYHEFAYFTVHLKTP